SAAPPLSSGSKSDDRRDDRPAASSPEPADKSRRLWPHPGRLRSPRAAILRRSDSRRLRQKRQHPNDENRDHETSHRPYSHLMSQPRSGVGKNPDPRGEGLGWVRGQWRGWFEYAGRGLYQTHYKQSSQLHSKHRVLHDQTIIANKTNARHRKNNYSNKIAEPHVMSKMDASSCVRPDDKSNIVTTTPTVPTKTEIPPSSQLDDEAKKTEKLINEEKRTEIPP